MVSAMFLPIVITSDWLWPQSQRDLHTYTLVYCPLREEGEVGVHIRYSCFHAVKGGGPVVPVAAAVGPAPGLNLGLISGRQNFISTTATTTI